VLFTGSFAGHEVALNQAKYVIRPPHTAEHTIEYIPTSSDRIAQLARDVFHLAAIDLPPATA
jgi:hypothetical protein